MNNKERGVSLVITFLIMTVMLAMVLSITLMLQGQFKIVGNIGNSVLALYAAESGAEKTLYFYRKHIPVGGTRGLCNLCLVCDSDECTECTTTPLAIDGCNILSCTNCQVTYNSAVGGKEYSVDAILAPDASTGSTLLKIRSKGYYQGTSRSVEVNAYSQ